MALKGAVVVTATKIVDGPKKAITYSGTGKDQTVITANIKRIHPTGTSDEDAIIEMTDGTLITCQVSFDDLNTDISATDSTGS